MSVSLSDRLFVDISNSTITSSQLLCLLSLPGRSKWMNANRGNPIPSVYFWPWSTLLNPTATGHQTTVALSLHCEMNIKKQGRTLHSCFAFLFLVVVVVVIIIKGVLKDSQPPLYHHPVGQRKNTLTTYTLCFISSLSKHNSSREKSYNDSRLKGALTLERERQLNSTTHCSWAQNVLNLPIWQPSSLLSYPHLTPTRLPHPSFANTHARERD